MKKERSDVTTPIWQAGGNGSDSMTHFMIMGPAGKGKSPLLQAEADRLGISYEDLQRDIEPTNEQREQMRVREEREERKKERRLQAVRQAIWDAWSDDESAFSRIRDALASTVMNAPPSLAQLKAVFMMLPATIVGTGLSWGFDDTEVGDDIHRFIDDNREAVVAQLAYAKV